MVKSIHIVLFFSVYNKPYTKLVITVSAPNIQNNHYMSSVLIIMHSCLYLVGFAVFVVLSVHIILWTSLNYICVHSYRRF